MADGSGRIESPNPSDLLAGIQPQLLAALLKENEVLASRVLSGFRPTAQAVKSPPVRQRLIREVEKDPQLPAVLKLLWMECNQSLCSHIALTSVREMKASLAELVTEFGAPALRVALLLDDRQSARECAARVSALPAVPQPASPEPRITECVEAARPAKTEEIEHFRKKIKDLEARVRELDRRLRDRERRLEAGQAELRAAKQQLLQANKRLGAAEKQSDRLRRARESAENEKYQLERELKQARKERRKPEQSTARVPEPTSQRNPDWAPVISTLLKNEDYRSVRQFCEALLSITPESLHAHLALERAYSGLGEKNRLVEECLWISDYMKRHGQAVRAATFACRALSHSPEEKRVQEHFKRLMEGLDPTDETAVTGINRLIVGMRSSSPDAHRVAAKIIGKTGKPGARTGDLHPDKILELGDGIRTVQTSTRRIAAAVDGNDAEFITFMRRALAHLRRTNPALHRSVTANLDASCNAVLRRPTRPVIVDGSNVAWHESTDKPRLKNVLDLRGELRAGGFFPIYIYVDAALLYQIDRQSALQRLVDSGAVIAAVSHTDADEEITAQALRLSCPVVTNDRMSDWDPEGEIPKIRFSIDRFGVTLHER